MNKRGQFYIIAAVILVGLIIGFGTTYNSISSSEKESSSKVLLNEIQYEISQIIDSAGYNDLSKTERSVDIDSILDAYAWNHPDAEFILIFGAQHEIKLGTEYNRKYSSNGNNVLIDYANLSVIGDTATITLSSDEKYEFPIKQQNLYLIVKTVRGDETDVATNN